MDNELDPIFDETEGTPTRGMDQDIETQLHEIHSRLEDIRRELRQINSQISSEGIHNALVNIQQGSFWVNYSVFQEPRAEQ